MQCLFAMARRCRELSAKSKHVADYQKNRDLTRHIASPNPSDDHYRLFKTYVTSRHEDGQMVQMDQYDFTSMISNSPIETVLISYNDAENNLVGAILRTN